MCAGNCQGCNDCTPVVLKGNPGRTGPPGPTPTFTVTATPLAAGEDPTIVQGGTALNPTLNFGIPAGATGATGSNGTDGDDATELFTTLTASFTQPSLNTSVTIQVGDSSWMQPGAWLYIRGGGYYLIASVPSATSVQIANPGSNTISTGVGWPTGVPGNATAGSTVNVVVGSLAAVQVIHAAVPGLAPEQGDPGPEGPVGLSPDMRVVYTVPSTAPVSDDLRFVFFANAAPPTPATSFVPYAWNGSSWVAGPNIAGQGGTKTFSGSADPDVTPPSGSNINDYYWRNQGSSVVLYERTGTTTWTVRATLALGAVTQTISHTSPGTVALDLANFSQSIGADKDITLNWDDTNNSEQGEWTVVLENVDGGSNIDLDFTAARWEYDPALTAFASLPISLAPADVVVIEFKKNVRSGLYVITNYFAPTAL